jgi:Ca2+-binding EF-hand superfamily protein
MQYVLLSMLIGALFGGGMAIAQSPAEPAPVQKPPRYLAKFDEQFKAADKDGDGALTRAEAEGANLSRIVNRFDQIDANKDGKATRDEIRSLIRNRLSS